jgi:UDP-2,4-diacetamido-2,4,6-trideoxy-beta-L-altropyranose hydrolase
MSKFFNKAFIRCDSSNRIGSGHVIRCMALAEILTEKNIPVEFICKNFPQSMISQIRKGGYRVHLLSPKLDQNQDAIVSLKIIKRTKLPLVIVDNYALDAEWESKIANQYHVLTIDDLRSRNHASHLILNPNFLKPGTVKYNVDRLKETILLLGPQNAILRKEFRQIFERKILNPKRSGITVFFGSYDESGETYKFLKKVIEVKPKLHFEIIVSSFNVKLKDIRRLKLPNNIQIHVQPEKVSKILLRTQLFIGAGGSITSERLICGLPGIVVSVAENQEVIAQNLAKSGVQIYLGPVSKVNYGNVIARSQKLLRDNDQIDSMRATGKKIIGPLTFDQINRLADVLWLRPATTDDANFLFNLRKEPSVAALSINQTDFTFSSHVKWLMGRIASSDTKLYVVVYRGKSCGQIRLDRDGTVSISLSRNVRGMGLSARALRLALRPGKYTAIIRPDNLPSLKLFRSVGFQKTGKVNINNLEFLKFSLNVRKSDQFSHSQ